MIGKLDHIGIAVRDLQTALGAYTEGLGLTCEHEEVVEDQKVRTAFLPVGDTNLELLETTSPDGPIGKFIEKRGEGIHHLCFEVEDIHAALDACRAAGLRLIDEEPRVGAHRGGLEPAPSEPLRPPPARRPIADSRDPGPDGSRPGSRDDRPGSPPGSGSRWAGVDQAERLG